MRRAREMRSPTRLRSEKPRPQPGRRRNGRRGGRGPSSSLAAVADAPVPEIAEEAVDAAGGDESVEESAEQADAGGGEAEEEQGDGETP